MTDTNTERMRKNLRITKEMADWLKSESDKKGINVNALINVILNEYKERNGG
jgi:Ribbon-helix-helix protein, copG family.